MNNVLPPDVTHQRALEWWCLLNAKKRPHDLPPDISVRDAFGWVDYHVDSQEALSLWNGDFGAGIAYRKFL
jgi:hypothetical protein